MTLRTLLMTTAMTGALLASLPATAAQDTNNVATQPTASTTASSTAPILAKQSDQQLQASAAEILGNISIANIALTYGMNDDASSHITAARKAISQFDSQMSPYKSATAMTAGKLSYKTAKGQSDYWIPVENDNFAIQTVDGKYLASTKPDIDVTNAQIVHYNVFLDTKIADQQLAKAQDAISQKQYDMAMTDLQNVSKGAITEMAITDKPLEATRDNLVLSKELLKNKDYRGASFALKHANTELAQYEKANPNNADTAKVKDMQSQIYSMQTSIDKQEPSALKTAEMKIDGWIKEVEAKFHA